MANYRFYYLEVYAWASIQNKTKHEEYVPHGTITHCHHVRTVSPMANGHKDTGWLHRYHNANLLPSIPDSQNAFQ